MNLTDGGGFWYVDGSLMLSFCEGVSS
jgi:hypothetical protein